MSKAASEARRLERQGRYVEAEQALRRESIALDNHRKALTLENKALALTLAELTRLSRQLLASMDQGNAQALQSFLDSYGAACVAITETKMGKKADLHVELFRLRQRDAMERGGAVV
jgi:hypothetical protein